MQEKKEIYEIFLKGVPAFLAEKQEKRAYTCWEETVAVFHQSSPARLNDKLPTAVTVLKHQLQLVHIIHHL